MSTYGPYPAIVKSWHDGDTCHMDVDLGFAIFSMGESPISGGPLLACRIQGINPQGVAQPINAPELGTDAGRAALAYAALQLCPPDTVVTVISHGWDKYGNRFDGQITLPSGRDFGSLMVEAGQAVWTNY